LRSLRLWRRPVYRLARPLFWGFSRVLKGVTNDVRAVVVDEAGRVLLVEHTYVRGWHLPGGGIERGEAPEEALARELIEEAGVRLAGEPRLVAGRIGGGGPQGYKGLLYRVDQWEACRPTSRGEILEREWFHPDALPEGATHWTRRRIERAFGPPSNAAGL